MLNDTTELGDRVKRAPNRPRRKPGSFNQIADRARTDVLLTGVDHRLMAAIERRWSMKPGVPYPLEALAQDAATTRASASRRTTQLHALGYIRKRGRFIGIERDHSVFEPVHEVLSEATTPLVGVDNTGVVSTDDTGVVGPSNEVLSAGATYRDRPSSHTNTNILPERGRAKCATLLDPKLIFDDDWFAIAEPFVQPGQPREIAEQVFHAWLRQRTENRVRRVNWQNDFRQWCEAERRFLPKPGSGSLNSCATEATMPKRPTERMLDHAAEHGLVNGSVEGEWQHWRDHHLSRGTAIADHEASWRTWVATSKKFPPACRSNRNGVTPNPYVRSADDPRRH